MIYFSFLEYNTFTILFITKSISLFILALGNPKYLIGLRYIFLLLNLGIIKYPLESTTFIVEVHYLDNLIQVLIPVIYIYYTLEP